MAYQIDFTAANYVNRSRRKVFLRLLALASIAGAAWGVYDVYKTYNQPTLNMKLGEYEAVAFPIEQMNAAWDVAAKEYNAMVRYYRLLWAANPTNFIEAMVSRESELLGRRFRPRRWSLATGGECKLDYLYVFDSGDKAEQTDGLEAKVSNAITSIVTAVGGKVDVQGVLHDHLLGVNELNVAVKFSLPDVMSFPVKERTLTGCVNEIAALRKKVQETKLMEVSSAKGMPTTAREIMMRYLPMGKDKPDFPDFKNTIDVLGWLKRADGFVAHHKMPVSEADRTKLRKTWNDVGEARFPWDRFRALDNDELVERTRVLGTVADGVKRFKGFLEQRHVDCRKKMEPFVEAYLHNDVFNKPLIESDLVDRVAKAVGIDNARISFKDESTPDALVLVKKDEKFTFTWVRWTLTVGGGSGGNGEKTRTDEAVDSADPITPAMLANCIKRTLELGPGYAMDSVKIDFGADGNVSGAVLEGLLPVKTVESVKGAAGNVD